MINEKWEYRDKVIYRNEEVFLTLDEEILNMIIVDNKIVVLLKPNPKIRNQNVFCYDMNRNIKWQIPAPVAIHKENDFTSIYLRDSQIYAYNRNGVEYNLDIDTGRVKGSELIK